MCTEPRSLAFQHMKPEEILKSKGNTVEMDHSEMTSVVKKHTVTAERGEVTNCLTGLITKC